MGLNESRVTALQRERAVRELNYWRDRCATLSEQEQARKGKSGKSPVEMLQEAEAEVERLG